MHGGKDTDHLDTFGQYSQGPFYTGKVGPETAFGGSGFDTFRFKKGTATDRVIYEILYG